MVLKKPCNFDTNVPLIIIVTSHNFDMVTGECDFYQEPKNSDIGYRSLYYRVIRQLFDNTLLFRCLPDSARVLGGIL